ncbi:hypothetical protein AB0N87_34980 [Streptomyces sp. NPDC093228]|uniref:hypothetical protein n=1 Tax=Streptomyces sp. NPDC093228 TaxID=3155070 RepID=UPI00343C8670
MISTGRRPRRSLSDPTVSRAPSSPTTYTAKTTVTMVSEKSQRSRYSGQSGDGPLAVAIITTVASVSR